MAKDLILTKESSESEIKAYFNAVLKLSQSDNEFPINFNEVWMLVYQDKRSAIFELKDKFIQDVDFQTVRRNLCLYFKQYFNIGHKKSPKPIWNCRKLEKFSAFFIY